MKIHQIVAVVAALSLPALAHAADAAKSKPSAKADASAGKTVTMKGEIVDSTCYFTKGAKGADHKDCAQSCLKSGATPSFLADDGKLYLLLAEHGKEQVLDDAKAKAGDTITITGTEMDKAGMKAIVLAEVK